MRKTTLTSGSTSSVFKHSYLDRVLLELDLKRDYNVSFLRSNIQKTVPHNGYRQPTSYRTEYDAVPHQTATAEITEIGTGHSGYLTEIHGTGRTYLSGFPNKVTPSYNKHQELLHKVLLKARDELWDVTMTFGELQATADGLTAMLGRVGRSMEAVRRKDARSFNYLWNGTLPRTYKGKEVSKKQMLRRGISIEQTSPIKGSRLDNFNRNVSSMWLEWKYGITPTLIDIQGACKALDSAQKGSLWEHTPIVTKRAQVTDSYTVNCQQVYEFCQRTYTKQVPVRVKDTYKARLDYKVTSDALRGLNRLGLGMSSIATLMWDKKPFSFVFDMAVPIASTIKATTALDGATPISYCETVHRDFSIMEGPNHIVSGSDHWYNVSGIIRAPEFRAPPIMLRTASSTPPIPLPFARNPLKAQNAMTVLSLFTQLRKSAK